MTDHTQIQALLTRYYEGLASLSEEKELHRLLRAAPEADLPAHQRREKAFFAALEAVRGTVPADGNTDMPTATARLARQIDQWERLESHTRRRTLHQSWGWMSGIAATIALCLTLSLAFSRHGKHRSIAQAAAYTTHQNSHEPLSPEDAAAATRRALEKFSTALNHGLDKLNP